MLTYDKTPPPYWWAPQPKSRRGKPTRPKRNPGYGTPWPCDRTRPGDK